MSENRSSNPFIESPAEPTLPTKTGSSTPNKAAPAAQPIRNVKDLVVLLTDLQARIEVLETENRSLKADLARKITKKEITAILAQLDQFRLPKLGLFSDSFFLRAISIYGHWFTANLIVSVILTIITTVIMLTVGQSLVEGMLNLP